MRIGELSKQAGVKVGTIRFYERRELLKSPSELPRVIVSTFLRSGFPWTGFLCQFASNGAGFFRRSLKIVQHLRDLRAFSG